MSRPLVALAALAILVSGAHRRLPCRRRIWLVGRADALRVTTRAAVAATDMLADIMTTPLIRCDEAQWDLFGISLAGFNALFSIGAAIAIFVLLGRRRAA